MSCANRLKKNLGLTKIASAVALIKVPLITRAFLLKFLLLPLQLGRQWTGEPAQTSEQHYHSTRNDFKSFFCSCQSFTGFAKFTSGLISYKNEWQKQWALLHEKRERSADANLKTVCANFLTKLHRTWVWWTRTKKKKLYRFSVQNLEIIVWKKKEEEKEKTGELGTKS